LLSIAFMRCCDATMVYVFCAGKVNHNYTMGHNNTIESCLGFF
jgi:hypothetical protein